MHVTIEETDEGIVICLHLALSETSSELRDFASLRPGPSPLPPRLTSTVPQIASRSEEPRRLPSLDVGVARVLPRPGRETIQAVLDAAIRAKKEPLGGAVGILSRGIGNVVSGRGFADVFNPRAGVSVSQQLAELTGTTVGEVHLGIAGPFLAELTSGGDFVRALTNDFRVLATAGNVPALERVVDRLDATEDSLSTMLGAEQAPGAAMRPSSFEGVSGVGRGLLITRAVRARRNVRQIKRQAELSLLLAERVQRSP